MTYPLILAKIPVKNPWEIFAYLPFGNWNECPDTPDLMAVAKYWFEQYGAIPAAMSHDELEFLLPAPVLEERAMEAATEQYGFCPDIVDQEQDDPTVGNLAEVPRGPPLLVFLVGLMGCIGMPKSKGKGEDMKNFHNLVLFPGTADCLRAGGRHGPNPCCFRGDHREHHANAG